MSFNLINYKSLAIVTTLCAIASALTDQNNGNAKIDCHLENKFTPNKDECQQRGCVWDPKASGDEPGVPQCYIDTDKIGYVVDGNRRPTSDGFDADLKLKDTAKNLLRYAPQISGLRLQVQYLTDNILRFKIYDPKHPRYEVPIQHDFPLLQHKLPKVDINSTKYSVELSENQTDFHLTVERKATKTKLFDTSIGGLIFSDQLIQIASYLASNNVYGMGENTHHSLRHDLQYRTWNLFARGIGPNEGITNLYGVHPFYTCLESDGKSHGILLLNSNAMEYTLMPAPAISLKTIGGILDFFVFVGDTPEHVIQLYTSLIGRPFIPAFWALGFQLTRYGYSSTQDIRQVFDRNIAAKVPLDVGYVDIDYMDHYLDFTYDQQGSFSDLPKLMNEMKQKHKIHFSLIIDPAIEANNSKYQAFTDGYEKDVFVKWPKWVNQSSRSNPVDVPTDKDVIYGHVWPRGYAAFPDFFKNSTFEWWKKWISHMYNELDLKFDALWIDMNEPFNFDCPSVDDDQPDPNCPVKCPDNKYDFPEVRIQSVWANIANNQLSNFTLCMVSLQGEDNQFSHYDVHSLYALTESIVTQKAVHEITGKRGFVLSRSSYVSAGRYTAHWTGDIASDWSHMRDTIVTVLEFNLFGLNFIGSDICGFFHNTTAQLCRRWSQLGAFYPFSRNHNEKLPIDQDPAVWAMRGHPEVTEAAVNSLNLRYRLLPYLYTLFFRSNQLGETVARPLFHEFSTDQNTHAINEQFMWGRSVLISPFLYENQTEVNAYIPKDVWYEVWPQIKLFNKTGHITIADTHPSGPPPIHLRGGSVIPMTSSATHVNTESVRQSNLTLVVLPDQTRSASGDLFWDDGESIDSVEHQIHNYYTFELHSNCTLVVGVKHSGSDANGQTVDNIDIYDTNGSQTEAKVDGHSVVAHPSDQNSMTRIEANIVLGSKKGGQQWVITWSSNGQCNFI